MMTFSLCYQILCHGAGGSVFARTDNHGNKADWMVPEIRHIIIIIIKNECHSNIIVDRLQGCGNSKKLRESESESRSSEVV